MKIKTAKPKKDGKDVLDHLGDFIEEHFKKSVKKVEEIFKDDEDEEKSFTYIRAFLDDKGVASVAPSSKFIVKRVLKAMDPRKASVVVEYGAAEGVITREILRAMPPGGRLIALELNEKLFANLKQIPDPRLYPVLGDVREVDKILERFGVGPGMVDSITSGIPFAFLRPRERHELLTKTSDFLKPGGRFVPYQVTTHLIPLLEDYFTKVKTEFEIRNLPPHFVFTASK